MKQLKVFLILAAIVGLLLLSGCEAQYRPNNGKWSFGTDASIYYTPENSNWTFKVFGN